MVRIATLADKVAIEKEAPVETRWMARTLCEQLGETAEAHGSRPALVPRE